MTLPSELRVSTNPEDGARELGDMYRNLRESIEGYTQEITGRIYGGSTEGTGTYTVNRAYYFRQGVVIDYFCHLAWSAHTGTGELRVELPFFEKPFLSSVSMSPVWTYDLAWPAGTIFLVFKGVPNERYGILSGCRDKATAQTVQMDGTGQIVVHHRYIGQVKQ